MQVSIIHQEVIILTKKQFIIQLQNSCVNLESISKRRIDYKYNEYLLFKILIKYNFEDLKILGLPDNLDFKVFPSNKDYDVLRRTHVTLNYQLYKLYECGYYTSEKELVANSLKAARSYKRGAATIKDLEKDLRKIRKEFIKEMNDLIS